MKKNKTMRAAGGLLIATLLSTSIVSGTFAKYVTSDKASDSARVAKFGVIVKADGNLFADTYKTTVNTPGENGDSTKFTALSVVSSALASTEETDHDGVDGTNKLVAPGTKNTEGLTFSVSGTPEVAVKVDFSISDDASDVWLGKGTYPNMTSGGVFDSEYDENSDIFSQNSAYYPIKYTLRNSNSKDPLVDGGTLNDVIDELNKKFASNTYDANTDLAEKIGSFTLTWEWEYGEEEGVSANDKADTLLGDLAVQVADVSDAVTAITKANAKATVSTPKAGNAGITAEDGNYNLTANFGIKITVTQVD